jgi:glioma pathogenesis-related protein 2
MNETERLEALEGHRIFRALHGSPPLLWDDRLARAAQSHAESLVRENTFEHGGLDVPGYGRVTQNMALVGPRQGIYKALALWYGREVVLYDHSKPGPQQGTGHFTALIWKQTTRLGVGVARKSNKCIIVANYWPPGNVVGQYETNVLPPTAF